MRLIIVIGFAAVLLIPAPGAPSAGTAPGLASQQNGDMSSAKKTRKAKKAVKKEEYLRAVPSTPPAGSKQ
jgi:hypothetical protein